MTTNSEQVTTQYTQRWIKSCENTTKQYVPEKYQLGIIADYLREEDVEFDTEKRIFSYPIDIVGIRGRDTIAIEMKSSDVSRGIEQAHRDASFVDYSYLAVWENQVQDSLIEQAENLPIGLMSISESVEVVVKAEKSSQQLCGQDIITKLINGDVRDDTSVQESQ